MKKISDIINRLWNVCGQMEVGALLPLQPKAGGSTDD